MGLARRQGAKAFQARRRGRPPRPRLSVPQAAQAVRLIVNRYPFRSTPQSHPLFPYHSLLTIHRAAGTRRLSSSNQFSIAWICVRADRTDLPLFPSPGLQAWEGELKIFCPPLGG